MQKKRDFWKGIFLLALVCYKLVILIMHKHKKIEEAKFKLKNDAATVSIFFSDE